MHTGTLKKFAQAARRQLLDQVGARMEQVLQTDSVEIREKEKVVKELQEHIKRSSKEAVIDQVAYTWFNRFCALRYMDVNHYARMGILSPVEGFTLPEILQEAKQGVIDESFKVDKQKVVGLLNGTLPSSNPQQEAYRLLLVGACNAYHTQMPFLFPKIDDYTELLMPDDLLSENSVLQGLRETLTEVTCRDVEVIGWLYQFYISEHKDEVFAGLKKNKKIEAEDIPAATQLFTPHWIVRYLVENSLGRLWMLNHPGSNLVEEMQYYIKPEEPETDYLVITSPEEIKVCDPACGSGHMLTYAFDLMYAIYQEEGYDPVQIPGLILRNNLFGIEIDQRAGHLAAFALMMKAREKDRRFFSRGIEPNICVLENVTFTPDEIENYKKAVGPDLFTQELWFLLQQFEQAENFGSLIKPQVRNPLQIWNRLQELGVFDDLFLRMTNQKVKMVLEFAEHLNPNYHVVVTNPPYMGRRLMNKEILEYTQEQFPESKFGLDPAFIQRSMDLVVHLGFCGMITMQSWMFLSSFEELRKLLITKYYIQTMAHLGPRAFDSIGGEVVSTTAFVFRNYKCQSIPGYYLRLTTGENEHEKQNLLRNSVHFRETLVEKIQFKVTGSSMRKIPSIPIIYWINDNVRDAFKSKKIDSVGKARRGLQTGDTPRFIRYWFETESRKTGLGTESNRKSLTWFYFNNGGIFRKWFGNLDYVVKWFNDGQEIKEAGNSIIPSEHLYFKKAITWSKITSRAPSFRLQPDGIIPGDLGPCFYYSSNEAYFLGLLNSKVASYLLKLINPTITVPTGDLTKLPFIESSILNFNDSEIYEILSITREDYDSIQTSWKFSKLVGVSSFL